MQRIRFIFCADVDRRASDKSTQSRKRLGRERKRVRSLQRMISDRETWNFRRRRAQGRRIASGCFLGFNRAGVRLHRGKYLRSLGSRLCIATLTGLNGERIFRRRLGERGQTAKCAAASFSRRSTNRAALSSDRSWARRVLSYGSNTLTVSDLHRISDRELPRCKWSSDLRQDTFIDRWRSHRVRWRGELITKFVEDVAQGERQGSVREIHRCTCIGRHAMGDARKERRRACFPWSVGQMVH